MKVRLFTAPFLYWLAARVNAFLRAHPDAQVQYRTGPGWPSAMVTWRGGGVSLSARDLGALTEAALALRADADRQGDTAAGRHRAEYLRELAGALESLEGDLKGTVGA